MVAGTKRFDTRVMQAVPRVFVKTGAEGVYCGCIPHAHIGIALKCDDGASRAAETAMASLLASLDVWTPEEKENTPCSMALLRPLADLNGRTWREQIPRWRSSATMRRESDRTNELCPDNIVLQLNQVRNLRASLA